MFAAALVFAPAAVSIQAIAGQETKAMAGSLNVCRCLGVRTSSGFYTCHCWSRDQGNGRKQVRFAVAPACHQPRHHRTYDYCKFGDLTGLNNSHMKASGNTVAEILTNLPPDRVVPFNKLHDVIVKNLPKGFEPAISYGGLGYVVPHKLYPAGYHCKPEEPLPFAGIASQKDSINFYHMGIYSDPQLYKWFVTEYPKHSKQKLDIGKSCVRFKKFDDIPYTLIGELMKKMSVAEWIEKYEAERKPKPKQNKASR